MSARILIADDEPPIRKLLRITLEANDFQVLEAANGQEAIRRTAADQPDALLLDLGLGDLDGQEVIRRIREWSPLPIVVLSVRASETEKVKALDAGADDYVVKPFSNAELLARLRAALRKHVPAGSTPEPVYEHDGLRIDMALRRVSLNAAELKLSRKEYALLALLARYAGRVVTQTQLLEDVWGRSHREDTHYLRVFIGQLRRKLQDDAAHPRRILTEPGVGYRLISGS